MQNVYKVMCEWDIGLNYVVYGSKDLAKFAAKEAISQSNIEESYEELEKEGLVFVETWSLIK